MAKKRGPKPDYEKYREIVKYSKAYGTDPSYRNVMQKMHCSQKTIDRAFDYDRKRKNRSKRKK